MSKTFEEVQKPLPIFKYIKSRARKVIIALLKG
jgi:hypothetical protein